MDPKRMETIITEIRDGTREVLGPLLDSLLLYGSYARNDYTLESDMDIIALVALDTHDEIEPYRRDLNRIASRVGLEYDIMVSLVAMPAKIIRNNANVVPFYGNVLREGVNLIA